MTGLAVVLAVSLAIAPLTAEAQPAGKVARIGYLLGATREQTSDLVAKGISRQLLEASA